MSDLGYVAAVSEVNEQIAVMNKAEHVDAVWLKSAANVPEIDTLKRDSYDLSRQAFEMGYARAVLEVAALLRRMIGGEP